MTYSFAACSDALGRPLTGFSVWHSATANCQRAFRRFDQQRQSSASIAIPQNVSPSTCCAASKTALALDAGGVGHDSGQQRHRPATG